MKESEPLCAFTLVLRGGINGSLSIPIAISLRTFHLARSLDLYYGVNLRLRSFS